MNSLQNLERTKDQQEFRGGERHNSERVAESGWADTDSDESEELEIVEDLDDLDILVLDVKTDSKIAKWHDRLRENGSSFKSVSGHADSVLISFEI